jgi:hypothetical protein
VLFADLKGSMELLADRDPEEARQLLDPVLERMMAILAPAHQPLALVRSDDGSTTPSLALSLAAC